MLYLAGTLGLEPRIIQSKCTVITISLNPNSSPIVNSISRRGAATHPLAYCSMPQITRLIVDIYAYAINYRGYGRSHSRMSK